MEDFLNSLLIIIVTYKQEYDQCATFRSLVENLCDKYKSDVFLYIYDNSPSKYENDSLHSNKIDRKINVIYNHDAQNSGLGVAYNSGAILAEDTGKKWLLLLDQDTNFSGGILENYFEAVISNKQIDIFAPTLFSKNNRLISPSKYFLKRGFALSYVPTGITSLKSITPINSGLLISLKLFNQVGGYDEKIKLDFSDHVFMDKIRKIRNSFYVIPCNSIHNLSSINLGALDNELVRFRFFCEGARNASKNISDSFVYLLINFLRAIKLSIHFKNFIFFIVLYRIWIQ